MKPVKKDYRERPTVTGSLGSTRGTHIMKKKALKHTLELIQLRNALYKFVCVQW